MYKIKKNDIGFVALFILFPLLGFIVGIRDIVIKRKRLWVVPWFLALSAMTFPPFYDLYRHFNQYLLFVGEPFEYILDNGKFDFIIYFIQWLYANIGLKFEWVRFTVVLLSYTLIMKLWTLILDEWNNNVSNFNKLASLVIILSFSTYISIAFGLRYGFAKTIYLYAVYQIFVRGRDRWFIAMIFAILTHYTFIPLVLISILARVRIFVPSGIKKNVLIFISLYLSSQAIFTFILSKIGLSGDLLKAAELYTEGYWGGEFISGKSFLGLFSFYMGRILTLIPCWYALNIKIKSNYLTLIILLMYYMFFVSFSESYFTRVLTVLSVVSVVYIFHHKLNATSYNKSFVVLFLVAVLNILQQFAEYKPYLATKYFAMSLCTPAPVIMYNSYTKDWVDKHINLDGDLLEFHEK